MSLLWLAPATAAVVGITLVAATARRAAEELQGLRADVRRFSELQPALAEVRRAAVDLRLRRR